MTFTTRRSAACVVVRILGFLLLVGILSDTSWAQNNARSARQEVAGAVRQMLTGSDEASLRSFVEKRLAPKYRDSMPEDELFEHLRLLRRAVNGASPQGLNRTPAGMEMIFSGERQARIQIQIENQSPWRITLLNVVEEGAPEDGEESGGDQSYDLALRARVRGVEALASSGGDDVLQHFIDGHLSDEFVASRPRDILLEQLRYIRSVGAAAGGIQVSGESGGARIGFRGSESTDVVIRLDEEPPYRISSLNVETDVVDDREEGETLEPISWDTLEDRLDEAEENGFSGTVMMVRNGEVTLHQGYGDASREQGIENSTETIFGIGSTPIDFTRAAILLLEQRGELDSSDPITSFMDGVPVDKQSITIEHLMTGRSGLPNFHHLPEIDDDYDLTWIDRKTAVSRILAQELLFDPGQDRAHSHSAFGLLAAIVEIVSEATYGEFLQIHFFEPAGMDRTGFYGPNPAFREEDVAVGYGSSSVGEINSPLFWGRTSWLTMGSGGMVSNPGDMFKWTRMIESGSVLKQAALEKFQTRGVLAGGSDRGFLFMYTSGYDNRMFLASNVLGMPGGISRAVARALSDLAMAEN